MDRVPRDPGGHARHQVAGMLFVDLRELVKFCQRARLRVRNLQLQNVAADELALANGIRELIDSAAIER